MHLLLEEAGTAQLLICEGKRAEGTGTRSKEAACAKRGSHAGKTAGLSCIGRACSVASPRGDSLGGRLWKGIEETDCMYSVPRKMSPQAWNAAHSTVQ